MAKCNNCHPYTLKGKSVMYRYFISQKYLTKNFLKCVLQVSLTNILHIPLRVKQWCSDFTYSKKCIINVF